MANELSDKIKLGAAYLSASGYVASYLGNEVLQKAVSLGKIEAYPLMGYISDLTLPGAATSWALFATTNKSKNIQRLASLTVASSFTLYEFFPFLKEASTFDPKDILCYFAGSLLAYAGIKFMSKRNLGTLENLFEV
tara:strand:+ start:1104 stop:1514 length:411 start_codon:yes stop_codon:yes gene_type:complete